MKYLCSALFLIISFAAQAEDFKNNFDDLSFDQVEIACKAKIENGGRLEQIEASYYLAMTHWQSGHLQSAIDVLDASLLLDWKEQSQLHIFTLKMILYAQQEDFSRVKSIVGKGRRALEGATVFDQMAYWLNLAAVENHSQNRMNKPMEKGRQADAFAKGLKLMEQYIDQGDGSADVHRLPFFYSPMDLSEMETTTAGKVKTMVEKLAIGDVDLKRILKYHFTYSLIQRLNAQKQADIAVEYRKIMQEGNSVSSLVSGYDEEKKNQELLKGFDEEAQREEIKEELRGFATLGVTNLEQQMNARATLNLRVFQFGIDADSFIRFQEIMNQKEGLKSLIDLFSDGESTSSAASLSMMLLGVNEETLSDFNQMKDDLNSEMKYAAAELEVHFEAFEQALNLHKSQSAYFNNVKLYLLAVRGNYMVKNYLAAGEEQKNDAFDDMIDALTELDHYIDLLINEVPDEKDQLYLINGYNDYRRMIGYFYTKSYFDASLLAGVTGMISLDNIDDKIIEAFYYFEKSKSNLLINQMHLGDKDNYFDMNMEEKKELLFNAIDQLGSTEAYINYLYVNDELAMMLITKKGLRIKYINLEARKKEELAVNERIRLFNKSIFYGLDKVYAENALELRKVLIPRVAPEINKLIIVTDQYLSQIPFEAFLMDKVRKKKIGDYDTYNYLVNKYELSYCYSLSLSNLLEEASDEPTFYGIAPVSGTSQASTGGGDFGEIDEVTRANISVALPSTKVEVDEISALFEDKKILIDEQATKVNVIEDLGNYNYIHFATHGVVNYQDPDYSGLVVQGANEHEILSSSQIEQMDLNCKQVVLSACETGLGKVHDGEGVYGLSRSFIKSGTSNLMVSLWKVADKSTQEFMTGYYGKLIQGNKSPARSISEMKRNFSRSELAKPYYWAPFVLIRNKL